MDSKKILKYQDYIVEMKLNVQNNLIFVEVKFPKTWSFIIHDQINPNITIITKKEHSDYHYHYFMYTNIENGYDIIFNEIDIIERIHKESEERNAILKEKLMELENIFKDVNNDNKKLNNLTFIYRKNKPRSKKESNKEEIQENVEGNNLKEGENDGDN